MRLVDADAMILRYQSHPDRHSKDYLSYITYEDVLDAVIYDLEREATVDAVPVVRCKDCKHRIPNPHGYTCKRLFKEVNLDHYCSWGERREDGNT